MSTTIRIALIFFTFLTFFIFLHFIRKFKLNIKYSILWILIALLLVFLGIFPELFIIISYKIGFLSTVNMIYLIIIFIGSINFGVGRNQRLFFLSIKKRDIGKNFRYNKITTNYRKEISLCPLLILSHLFSI